MLRSLLNRHPLLIVCLFCTLGSLHTYGQNELCTSPALQITVDGKCQHDEIRFTCSPVKGAQFEWDFNGDGQTDLAGVDLHKTSYVLNSTGDFSVNLLVTLDACSTSVSNTFQVVSRSKPVFTLEQNCESVEVTNYSSGYDSLLWNISDGTRLTDYDWQHTFSRTGIFELELTTYKNGCVTKEVKDVEIQPVVAKPVLSENLKCAPAHISFFQKEDDKAQHRWYLNGQIVSSAHQFDSTFQIATAPSLSLSVWNKAGCQDSIHIPGALTITEPLVANFTISDSAICEGTVVTFQNTGSEADVQQWIFGDGDVSKSRDVVSHQYSAGEYKAGLAISRSSDGCSDTLFKETRIQVFQKPNPALSASIRKGCLPLNVELSSQFNGVADSSFLVLNQQDTLSPGLSSLTFQKPGIQEVRLVMMNSLAGCQAEALTTIQVIDTASSAFVPIIKSVSISDDERIDIKWSAPENVEDYQLYRKGVGGFEWLAALKDTSFVDMPEALDSVEYCYVLKAVNTCGFESSESNAGNSIVLNGSFSADSFPTLRWSEYRGWAHGVSSYNVYRNDGDGFQLVAQTEKPFLVDKDFDNGATLKATYRIEAIQRQGNHTSVSNTWSFNFQPMLFIPNAFTPNHDNVNDYFEVKGHGMEEVNIRIFNKWGERVFDSQGKNIAWDGKFKGVAASGGTYVCIIKTRTPEGREYEFQRTIHLIL